MTKRAKREPYNEFGFPASWNVGACGMPSFGAYRSAMEFCQQRSVDLHQEWSEGFAYEPQVLVGLPSARTYSPYSEIEEAPLVEQESLATEKTVV